MTSQFLIPLAGTVAVYALYQLAKIVYDGLTSPLRHLPGPEGGNFLLGHFRRIQNDSAVTDEWRQEFGVNYQMKSFFNARDLYTTDTRALTHILVNDNLYQKGPVAKKFVTHFLGNGLLAVEMEEHRRQNPAFGVPQIRELTPIFNQKSLQLRDVWTRQIGNDTGSSRIDVFAWLRKMTLDVIGEAGFKYQFNALEPKGQPNTLDEALTRLMHSPQAQRQAVIRLVQAIFPILSIFPTPGAKMVDEARTTMVNIAKQLLAASQADIKAGGEASSQRDLLSLMVQSNMSPEIREDLKLSDSDVIAHLHLSAATALALHALSLHPSVQKRLRDELLTVGSDNPTMDDLNSLPYLETVLREVMRVYPPVAFTMRQAMKDDVLPLSKQYLDRNGKAYDSIRVNKGTSIRIPIAAVNREKELWGDDADLFRPDRWDSIPEASGAIPSVWANLLTFLAGPHNCIGFRFSLVEIKSLLFTLLRAFEFEPAVPEGGIGFSITPVMRPKVLSEPEGGNQLPLIVRPYVRS
ncbi:cytochrome P450 monooxygenase [Mycena polygramma]|nr:cytochrome P450 monooxygenase [Mycena polygramma]